MFLNEVVSAKDSFEVTSVAAIVIISLVCLTPSTKPL